MKHATFLLIAWILLVFEPHTAGAAVPLPGLAKPTRIAVDGGTLAVADGTTVHLYDLDDPSRQRKFGREGEGPGEFKGMISDIEILPDRLVINSIGRISWFSRDGRFLRQQNDSTLGVNYRTLGDGFVGMKMVRDTKGIFFAIALFSADLDTVKELHRYRHPFFNGRRPINAVNLRVSSYRVYRDRVYVDVADGTIHVFDRSGNRVRTVTAAVDRPVVTAAHRERLLRCWKTDLKAEFEAFRDRLSFPNQFPSLLDFMVADDRIYLITHEEKDGRNRLLILDMEGKEKKRLWIMLADVNTLLPHLLSLYTIRDRVLYKLVDNEKTESWELRTIALE